MKYDVYTMEEALDEIIDYRGKTPQKVDKGGVPTLSAKAIKNNCIDYELCYCISLDEYKRFMTRGMPKIGDVLLTTEAPLGMVARLDRDDIAIAQRLLTLRGKAGILDNEYLFYYLQSPRGQAALRARETGTTVTGIKQSEFRKMQIYIPSIENQRKIGKILGDIDRKITINKEINKNLSNLLQTIYQKRFGEVSLGAKQGILSDICSYSKEKVAVSELNVNTYFSTENMLPEKAGSTKATSLPTTPQTTACRKGDTLISNIRPYFKKIVYCEDMCGCSTDVLCFTPVQSQYAAYLFSTLYTDKFFAFMVAGSKGTKMPRGDKQQIMTYPVVVPAESELEEFNAIAFPVLEQLNSNKAENKRLSALRDALLPKLMSGEIDISAIDL